MKKINAIFRLFVIRALQYRSEMLIWLFIESSPFLVMFALWQKVFDQQASIKGFTLVQIIQYYLLILIVSSLVDSHFEGTRCQEVRLGKIDFKMIRPLSYFQEILWQDLSSKFIYFLLGIPVFLAIFVFLVHNFNVSSLNWPSVYQWGWFSFFMIVGFALNFLLAFWIVLGAFWMEGSQGLEHFKWILVNLFSGMIPLAFLPGWMQQLANLLPFKFMLAVPIGVMQDTYVVSRFDVSYALGAVAVMSLVAFWGWQRAIMKYSSVGG